MQTTPKGIKYPDTGDDMSLAEVTYQMAVSIDQLLWGPMAAGLVTGVGTSNVTVEFPEGRFETPPYVFLTAVGTSSGSAVGQVVSVTEENFVLTSSLSNRDYYWVAIGVL